MDRPYTDVKKGFRAACEEVGVRDFRFHRLWARNLAKESPDEYVFTSLVNGSQNLLWHICGRNTEKSAVIKR